MEAILLVAREGGVVEAARGRLVPALGQRLAHVVAVHAPRGGDVVQIEAQGIRVEGGREGGLRDARDQRRAGLVVGAFAVAVGAAQEARVLAAVAALRHQSRSAGGMARRAAATSAKGVSRGATSAPERTW